MGPDDRGQSVPVIVTLTSDAVVAGLEGRGLRVERTLETISAVAGRVEVGRIDDLARLDEVQTIEYDGDTWAF